MRQKKILPEDFLTGVSRSQSGIEIVSGFILFAKTKNHEKAISREIENPLPISAVENHLPSRRLFESLFPSRRLFQGFPIHGVCLFEKLFSSGSFIFVIIFSPKEKKFKTRSWLVPRNIDSFLH